VPTTRVDALAVGVFGLLDADESVHSSGEDCYSAFRALSSAVGILSSADADDSARGLWGMNDAGGPWLGDDPIGRRGEFQVYPEHDGSVPLPVEAFTTTAVAAVGRFGPLELHGLEYYVPISLAGPATTRLDDGWRWFALDDPRDRAPLLVTLDSGDSPSAVERRLDIHRALEEVSPAWEGLDPMLLADADAVDFADPVPWRWWLGDGPPHTATFSVTAMEWAPLAIGRVVTTMIEACRSIGLTDHLGLRIVRSHRS
jgi:hypothetical protein